MASPLQVPIQDLPRPKQHVRQRARQLATVRIAGAQARDLRPDAGHRGASMAAAAATIGSAVIPSSNSSRSASRLRRAAASISPSAKATWARVARTVTRTCGSVTSGNWASKRSSSSRASDARPR